MCGIEKPTGATAFPSAFASGDYCTADNTNLLVAGKSWVIDAITGALFDNWTTYIATTTGC